MSLRHIYLVCVACAPRYKTSQELIGHDPHSNTYNYKYSFSVEIVPVCKNDIVCLSPKLSQQLGNFGPLAVCQRVTSSVQLVDPHTLRGARGGGIGDSVMEGLLGWWQEDLTILGFRVKYDYKTFCSFCPMKWRNFNAGPLSTNSHL